MLYTPHMFVNNSLPPTTSHPYLEKTYYYRYYRDLCILQTAIYVYTRATETLYIVLHCASASQLVYFFYASLCTCSTQTLLYQSYLMHVIIRAYLYIPAIYVYFIPPKIL